MEPRKAIIVPEDVEVWVHFFYIDKHNEPTAIVEYEGGSVGVTPAVWLRFLEPPPPPLRTINYANRE